MATIDDINSLIRKATMGAYHNMDKRTRKHLQEELHKAREGLMEAFKKGKKGRAFVILDSIRFLSRHQVAKRAHTALEELLY